MVKPDVKQNYYADLELPTSASIDDIRKAYRKLALQYHPDRNAGKEAECVPRFQAIQAANEILSDPVLKAKYDQDRRKAGLYPVFKTAGPAPTGNPYTATSAYPPPPRRTQPGTWQRPQASTYGQPSGADRFSNFPKPGGAPPRRDPAAERTQQFRAWQNMNSGPERPKYGAAGQPPPPPPRSPNPQAQAQPPPQPQNTGRPRMNRQDTKMPTEEQIRAGMRHGKTASQGDSPAAEKQSAWQAFQTANAGKPGTGGATTARPRRPAPTTPKRPGGFDPNAPGSDERPAPTSTGHYFHRNRSEDMGNDGFPPPPPGPPPATAPSSPTTPNGRPFADPLRPFRSREGEGQVPYAEGNRARTPYSSFIGEKTQFSSDGLRRSASTRDTNRLNPESNKTSAGRAQSSSPPLARKQADTPQPNGSTAKGQPFIPGMYSDSSDSTEDSSDAEQNGTTEENDGSNEAHPDRPSTAPSDNNPFQSPPRDRPIRKPKPPSSRLNGSNLSGSNVSPERSESAAGAQFDADHPTMQQRKSSTNIFTFAVNDDTFTPTGGKTASAEEINTNFSPGGWSGEFKGTPEFKSKPDYFGARRPSPAGRRTPNSRQGRPATFDIPNVNTDMPPPPRPDGSASMYASPSDVKFSEEQWKSTFKDASWTWQGNGTGSANSSKTPSRKNSSRLRTQTSADDFATGSKERPHVIVDDEHVTEGSSGAGGAAGVDVDDAMDIDTPPPAGQPFPTPDQGASSTKEPRLYSVPPSTWRQEQQKKQERKASAHRRTSTEPRLATNLDDLAHVEPLARNAEGLQNLADMSSTLPFDSQAAHSVSDNSKGPDRLQMPPVPKVPEKPLKLTKASWHSYALSFGNYLQHFHAFNKTMLAHMDARQKQAEARLLRGSLWLEAGGDTSDNQGFDSYLKGVREDEQVRETWNIGSEKHLEAVIDFDKMRDRVKKLTANGALVDA